MKAFEEEWMIDRFAQLGNALHGRLLVDRMWVCDTLENTLDFLPEGEYWLAVRSVGEDDDKERMLVIDPEGRFPLAKLKEAVLPVMMRSNGPWGLTGGNVSLGICDHLGYIVHCETYHEMVFRRLATELGGWGMVRLVIGSLHGVVAYGETVPPINLG